MNSLETAILAREREIRSLHHEEAYGWGFNGIQTIHKVGNEHEIKWSLLDRSRVIMGYMTHNHPYPGFPCPSWADLCFMKANNLKQLRACSRDLFVFNGIRHSTVTRNGLTFPRFEFSVYKTVLKNVLEQNRVPYTEDNLGIHPREILKYSIDAMDQALNKLSTMWGFTYKWWTDK